MRINANERQKNLLAQNKANITMLRSALYFPPF